TLEEWFDTRLKIAETLSHNTNLIKTCQDGQVESANTLLADVYKTHGVYENVILMNTEGVIIAAAAPEAIGLPVKEIPEYTVNIDKAVKGESLIGEAYASPVTGRPVSLITVPIILDDKVIGILGTPIDLMTFSKQFIDPITIGNTGNIAVIDSKGITLAHKQADYILKVDLSQTDFGKQVLKQKNGFVEYVWEGVDKFTVFREYKDMGWIVMSLAETNDFLAQISTIKTVVIISIILCLFVISALVYFISKKITKPLQESVAFAQKNAQGDFTGSLTVNTKDEVGDLVFALNSMVETLTPTISQISESSEQVSASSEQLSASAQNLASASSEQSSNLEETSSSVTQLANSIKDNTELANQAFEIAEMAGKELTRGNQAVEKTVAAMKRITDQIQIVDDIADQTNLLALNAAIEAARAGDVGKGFAVVAVEVRKLAERSQQASREIQDLAKESVTVAEEAGSIISAAVPGAQQNAQLSSEIRSICQEQSRSSEQIREAISMLDQITQQNSATSEETASSSEELASQAQALQQLVANFQIRNQRAAIKKIVSSPKNGSMYQSRFSPSKQAELEFETEFANIEN
ncbi:Cache 3/Cache 2 fusion domain-containing protein, partial [bacterium]|nr:Cache 3/Cache 2 fusion domain-containing protein [bacterium]